MKNMIILLSVKIMPWLTKINDDQIRKESEKILNDKSHVILLITVNNIT